MSPNEVVRSLSDDVLRQCAQEAIEWRSKGVLTGQSLRNVAQRLVADTSVEDFDADRMADSLVIEEAAARFARQSG